MIHIYDPKNTGNKVVEYLKEISSTSDSFKIVRNDEYFFTAKAGARLRFNIFLAGIIIQTREISFKLNDDGEYDYILTDMASLDLNHLKTEGEPIGFEVGAL